MTPEEIREQKTTYRKIFNVLTRQHYRIIEEAEQNLRKQMLELQNQCTHPNMQTAQYSRWCPDCDYGENTT